MPSRPLSALLWLAGASYLACPAQGAAQQAKTINVAMQANWTVTPVPQEVSEYLSDENPTFFWSFIDAWREVASHTDQQAYQAALDAASVITSAAVMPMLQLFLSTRSYSPKIHMFR